jgi:hypothetical protein
MDYPDEAWYYYQFADRFGWTPDQVDNLPAVHSDWLLAISNAVEEVKAERAEQADQ